jgi:RNA polymerase sigma-70 factor (ECF subfamily)
MGMTTEECKEIICQNYKEIYRFALYLTDDPIAAEDLTQEIFISAWTNADTYKAKSSVKTWLHRIAFNKFIDSKRELKRYNVLLDNYEKNKVKTLDDFEPLRKIIADEDLSSLYKAIHTLEEPDYVCIVLHYIQGLSFSQVADVLRRPVGTVKWQINQAIKKIKECLIDEYELE